MELLMWMHLGGIASLLLALGWLSYRIGGAGTRDQYGPTPDYR